ncbi:MAG: T9SS type A sorting domain-containing protein, partial [Bacteroidales bacterium]
MLRPYFGYKSIIGLPVIEKSEISLSIYPNPTNSILNINLSENGNEFPNSNYELRIANMMGKEVYNSSYKNQINVSNLSSGVYIFYLINKETNQTIKQKLIIQK